MSDSESEKESKIKPEKLENESSSDEERGATGGGARPKTTGSRLVDAGKSLKKAVLKGAGELVKSISPSKSRGDSPGKLPQRPSEPIKSPGVGKGRPQSKSPHEDSTSSKQTPQPGPSGFGRSPGLKRGRSMSRSPPAGPCSSKSSPKQGTSRPSRSPAKRSIIEKVKGMTEMEVIPDDETAFLNEEIDTEARAAGVRSPQKTPVKEPTATQLRNDMELMLWNFKRDCTGQDKISKPRLEEVDTVTETVISPMKESPPGDLKETAPSGEASGEAATLADRRPDEAVGPERVNEAFVPEDEVDVPEHEDEATQP